ncbi:MAG: MFS transporter [Bacteroidia bacterium]
MGERRVFLAILTATLGYFVDIYDLILFGIVRIGSLRDLGVISAQQVQEVGVLLLNWQMFGMLVGGLLFGVMGDRYGRMSVLFASILMYSLANIFNGMVRSVEGYALWRFVAGVGLAGELGAGITLTAELMPARVRGWGATIIATFGILGAVAASLTGKWLPWRHAYYVGGALGLVLLLLRIGVHESGLFAQMKQTTIRKGDLWLLFSHPQRLKRYALVILAGVPIWYIIGILIVFATELYRARGIEGIDQAYAVLWSYSGVSVGNLLAGILSQKLQSRRKPTIYSLVGLLVLVPLYVWVTPKGLLPLMWFILGLFSGYWAVLILGASEQFGTNLRATVTTSVPNFIRGSVPLITAVWEFSQRQVGLLGGTVLVGYALILIGLGSAWLLKETFGAHLDFYET